MTFLTPLGALAALAAALPLVAWLAGQHHAAAVGRALGLPAPGRLHAARVTIAVGAVAALGLAAAQPALTHASGRHERTGVEALFVFDTSRSMAAAATAASPTRLDRAIATAKQLRSTIADVPSGIATLTDRVLPDLFPVADVTSFDNVADRAVAIESPPPAATDIRATTYSALDEVVSGNYFRPGTTRRLVVLLTDGESNPVDTSQLAHALSPSRGYRFVAVRFWHAGESVYDANGKAESAYRPDPLGRVVLDEVAAALGGEAYDASDSGAAASALRRAVGSGPTTSVPSPTPARTPLAPWLAALALALILIALAPIDVKRGLQSVVR
jgi:hypothetical protein